MKQSEVMMCMEEKVTKIQVVANKLRSLSVWEKGYQKMLSHTRIHLTLGKLNTTASEIPQLVRQTVNVVFYNIFVGTSKGFYCFLLCSLPIPLSNFLLDFFFLL